MANKIIKEVIIGRAINGISINGLEYVLDENNEPIVFDDVEDAMQHLRDNGYEGFTNEKLDELFTFEEI